jgi:hypothetical protein
MGGRIAEPKFAAVDIAKADYPQSAVAKEA